MRASTSSSVFSQPPSAGQSLVVKHYPIRPPLPRRTGYGHLSRALEGVNHASDALRHAVAWIASCSNSALQAPGSSQPTGPEGGDSTNAPPGAGAATDTTGSGVPQTAAPCVADPDGNG